MSNVFVIAEAGISHDGDLDKALHLIDVARSAGADAVKFQTFNAQKLAARRKKPELFTLLKPYEMPLTWLPVLKEASDKAGIEFMTTCFDEETLKIVAPFVKRFKIGHGEAQDLPLLRAHEVYGKQIIRSICSGDLPAVGRGPYDTKILLCTKKYPTPINEVRLGDFFGPRPTGWSGFSDHTQDLMMGALAVAAGARIVEVHFRLWETEANNPDLCVSHPPPYLIKYVENLRHAAVAVYGAAEEETKILAPDGSAPRTSHLPSSGVSDPSGGPLAGLF